MRALRHLPAALAFAMLAFPFPHWDVLHSPNELSRVYQVRALVDDHAISVNQQVTRYGTMGDLSASGGHLYPNKAPGISFLGAPVYFVVRLLRGGMEHVDNRGLLYFLRLFCCVLPTLLVAAPLRRYARRVSGDPAAADAATLVFLFGSLALSYSLLFFSHALAGALAIGSFLAFDASREKERPLLQVLGGVLAGYAVVTEYTLAPVAVMLAAFGTLTAPAPRSAFLRLAAGALPCAILLGAYHQSAWGSPFAVGYQHVQNQAFAGWHAQGVMGVSTPKLSSLAGNLFSLARGLFVFSPAMALGMAGLWLQRREDRPAAALGAGVTAFYLFIAASFLYEAWGWMLGPRHLVPLVPFLVPPLACAIAWLRRKSSESRKFSVLAGAAAGLVLASIGVTGFCTAVYPHIPDEFSAALAHVVWPFARNGYFPWNLHRLAFGTTSLWGWWVWLACLGGIALLAARLSVTRTWAVGVAVLVAAGFVSLHFVLALPLSANEKASGRNLMDAWEPVPETVRAGLFTDPAR